VDRSTPYDPSKVGSSSRPDLVMSTLVVSAEFQDGSQEVNLKTFPVLGCSMSQFVVQYLRAISQVSNSTKSMHCDGARGRSKQTDNNEFVPVVTEKVAPQ